VKHADVQDMARAACACKSLNALRDSDQLWWRPSCEALGAQARLYVPHTASGGPIHGGTWKEHFFHLWAARDRWSAPDEPWAESVRNRFQRLVEDGEKAIECDENVADIAEERDESTKETAEVRARRTRQDQGSVPLLVGGVQIEHGSMRVSVRMRPERLFPVGGEGDVRDKSASAVVLPLHQRLRIVKAHRGDSCTTSDAMRVLMEESGRLDEASRSPWADAEMPTRSTAGDPSETSKPARRAPRDVTNDVGDSRGEEKNADQAAKVPASGFEFSCGVLSVDEKAHRILAVAPGIGLREFAFDNVFGAFATQAHVYEKSARPLVADFVNGFNGAVIVFGQTGSGKSHTMFGGASSGDTSGDTSGRGIVPRACEEILRAVQKRETEHSIRWTLRVSYVEVYGKDTFDLLNAGARVGQSRVAARRYVLDGDASREVRTLEDVSDVLKEGDAQKRRAATAMNDRSSRAHAIFSLELLQTTAPRSFEGSSGASGDSSRLESRLRLVDLGGSERLRKSRANENARSAGTVPWSEYYASRRLLAEAANINVGLLALKRCVDAIRETQRSRREGKPATSHVPYSDSKLTELLADALGGDGKTSILVTAAPEHDHAVETVQSLRFGERCASVETRARAGNDPLAGTLSLLDARVAACERKIAQTETWVTTRAIRKDAIDGTEETVVVSKLSGAERFRAELEKLLLRRAFLAGRVGAAAPAREPFGRARARDF